MPGKATVSKDLITGILEGLTKIKGEPSIAITRGEVSDGGGKKDVR